MIQPSPDALPPLRDRTTVYFDIETAGLNRNHPVIQIGAIAVAGDRELEAFERKLQFNPAAADREALEMNSYNRDDWVREAMPPEKAAAEFAGFCRRHAKLELVSKRGNPYRAARLAGYNCVAFDIPRTRDLIGRVYWPACWWYPLDVYQRVIWHFEESGRDWPANFQQPTVAEYFGIDVGDAHDALDDARTTWRIAQALRAQVSA